MRYIVTFCKSGSFYFLIADSHHTHKYGPIIPEPGIDRGSDPDMYGYKSHFKPTVHISD